MSIILVQKTSTWAASGSSLSLTLPGVTAGNTVMALICSKSTNISSIQDTNGTFSTAVTYSLPQTVGIGIYYVPNAAGGNHPVTMNMTQSTDQELFLAEYSGLTATPLDVVSAVAHGSTYNPASATKTPTNNNELIIGFIAVGASGATFSSWGSSLVQEDTQSGGPSAAWADSVQTTATAASATATPSGSSSNWVACIACFIASASSSSQTPYMPYGLQPILAQ